MPDTSSVTAPVTAAAPVPSIPTSVTGVTLAVRQDEQRWNPTRTSTPTPATSHEPDVQLSLANERTFLAWERTALGLITAGLAITQLLPSFDFPGGRRLIGLPLIGLGIVIAAVSYWEWRANQEAMRHDRALPRSWLPLIVAVVVAVVARVRLRAGDRRGIGLVNPPRRVQPSASRLADERTDLAWNRSGLAMIGCGLVVMRGLTLQGLPPRDVAVGAVIFGLGMASYFLAVWHAGRRLSPDRVEQPARPSDLWPLAFGVTAIGVAAFALGLFFPT